MFHWENTAVSKISYILFKLQSQMGTKIAKNQSNNIQKLQYRYWVALNISRSIHTDASDITITFSCKQDSKTGCRFIKKVYDKSSTVKRGSHCKEYSPSEPTDGQDININDSISGQDAVVADKQSSLSWLYAQNHKDVSHRTQNGTTRKKQPKVTWPAKWSIQRR